MLLYKFKLLYLVNLTDSWFSYGYTSVQSQSLQVQSLSYTILVTAFITNSTQFLSPFSACLGFVPVSLVSSAKFLICKSVKKKEILTMMLIFCAVVELHRRAVVWNDSRGSERSPSVRVGRARWIHKIFYCWQGCQGISWSQATCCKLKDSCLCRNYPVERLFAPFYSGGTSGVLGPGMVVLKTNIYYCINRK